MVFYDLQQKLQEKFNSKEYKRLLFEGKQNIIKRYNSKSHLTCLTDINDGRVHIELYDTFLKYQQNMVFQIFIDGVSPFKGSSENLIPVYLVNVQIPFERRYDLENMVMVAMVSIKGECDVQEYFKRITEKLNKTLAGFNLILNDITFKCKGVITSIILDTKERQEIFYQSNGLFLFNLISLPLENLTGNPLCKYVFCFAFCTLSIWSPCTMIANRLFFLFLLLRKRNICRFQCLLSQKGGSKRPNFFAI